MLRKSRLTISLLVPMVAASAAAHAGSTITDKSYWPNEARRSAQTSDARLRGELNSAFAYDRAPLPLAESAWRYHGGPKSR